MVLIELSTKKLKKKKKKKKKKGKKNLYFLNIIIQNDIVYFMNNRMIDII